MSRSRRKIIRRKNKSSKKIKVIIIPVIILLLFIMIFSIIFSLINIGNSNIIRGGKKGNLDISNLSQEEATNKLNNWYEELINLNIKIKYEQLEEEIKIEEFEPNINIDKIVNEALMLGKSGNIIKDNYNILYNNCLF